MVKTLDLALGSSTCEINDTETAATITADAFAGDVTGDLTGDVTGDLTGDVTGDLTGDIDVGKHKATATVLTTAAPAIDVTTTSYVEIDSTSNAVDATIAAPVAGHWLVITMTEASNSSTVTSTAGDFDGTNNTATFNAVEETLVLFGVSSTRWVIVENIGSVGLSAV